MLDYKRLSELLFDSLKTVLFPEEWLDLDSKFSKSEIFALLLIDKKEMITMTEMAEYIHAPLSTATGIIDRLVKNGYVKRARSEADRRIVVLCLDQQGVAVIGKIHALLAQAIEAVREELSDEDQQYLLQIFLRVIDRLKAKFSQKEADGVPKGEALRKIEIE